MYSGRASQCLLPSTHAELEREQAALRLIGELSIEPDAQHAFGGSGALWHLLRLQLDLLILIPPEMQLANPRPPRKNALCTLLETCLRGL